MLFHKDVLRRVGPSRGRALAYCRVDVYRRFLTLSRLLEYISIHTATNSLGCSCL